jgi:7,8-dihydropterin-6-yl-methyl-4-(beta-D-ribofuranosyl)aminobenzene 5'-phosphate synthase
MITPLTSRITILVDNNVFLHGKGLIPEHGFSALIERDSCRILFDGGQGQALIHNSDAMGVNLGSIDLAIFSHGHYDHTGGLLHVAKLNSGLRVILHPGAFDHRLSIGDSSTTPRSIGMPFSRSMLEDTGTIFETVTDFREILPGVWFTGEVPRVFGQFCDPKLVRSLDKRFVPDMIQDDSSMIMDTPSGPVLLLGCAHAGLRNILHHIRQQLDIVRIHAVIGGTHLGPADKTEILSAIDALEEFGVERIAPLHCTGIGPSEILKARFGKRFVDAGAGKILDF